MAVQAWRTSARNDHPLDQPGYPRQGDHGLEHVVLHVGTQELVGRDHAHDGRIEGEPLAHASIVAETVSR